MITEIQYLAPCTKGSDKPELIRTQITRPLTTRELEERLNKTLDVITYLIEAIGKYVDNDSYTRIIENISDIQADLQE